MTERRCIRCDDLMAEGDAKALHADAQPVAWVHPTCLEDYTKGGSEISAAETTEIDEGFKKWMEASQELAKTRPRNDSSAE